MKGILSNFGCDMCIPSTCSPAENWVYNTDKELVW